MDESKLPVVVGVLEHRGRYLLGRRSAQKLHAGWWCFPGGKVNPDELLGDALRREYKEEVSLDVNILSDFCCAGLSPSGRVVLLAEVDATLPLEPLISAEFDQLSWFTPEQALELKHLLSSARDFFLKLPSCGAERPSDFGIPAAYRQLYVSEGWDLFTRSDDDTLEIEHIDDPEEYADERELTCSQTFENDRDAIDHVIAKALSGSVPHMLALWMDSRSTSLKRPSHLWIPPCLLPADTEPAKQEGEADDAKT